MGGTAGASGCQAPAASGSVPYSCSSISTHGGGGLPSLVGGLLDEPRHSSQPSEDDDDAVEWSLSCGFRAKPCLAVTIYCIFADGFLIS
jgi:hypothetical protein